ncbi:WecB/TagA/CpsF family glycosyltransferase [Methylotenera sp.]|uniref:WecB/TagA/CpsF family glycosyltransferase n=1 Tax=Methylotenera sp. TaxID=2051956 RepID=UPI002ED7DAB0
MNSRTYQPISAQTKGHGKFILGCFINAGSWYNTINRIHRWTATRESRYVCICNVHSLVTARQDEAFRKALMDADMATPDGMPIAWMLRQMGFPNQQRINGPDLMWNYCQLAERINEPIFLYGSTQKTLDILQQKLLAFFPKLLIAGTCSPPFRKLTNQEDTEIVNLINQSGARVVFVSLGCPKQELWMAEQRGKINAVMVGVGAAFDYHAGSIKRAPLWMQHHGLEWLHRLYSEPRRLWKRYIVTNSIFILAAGWQLIVYKWKM